MLLTFLHLFPRPSLPGHIVSVTRCLPIIAPLSEPTNTHPWHHSRIHQGDTPLIVHAHTRAVEQTRQEPGPAACQLAALSPAYGRVRVSRLARLWKTDLTTTKLDNPGLNDYFLTSQNEIVRTKKKKKITFL